MVRQRKSTGLSSTTFRPTSPRPSSLTLNNVIQLRPRDPVTIETSVIAVPGYGTPSIKKWKVNDELRRAATGVPSISTLHIFVHHPSYDLGSDEFSWDQFLKTGNDLAEDVAALAVEHPHRSIIFIGHCLGGVLLKQALALVNQNLHDFRFRSLLECVSGIVFLGTPHSSVNDRDTLIRHNEILYNCAKIALHRGSERLPPHDVTLLSNLAQKFEQLANIPVLSVYEQSQMRSQVQKIFGGKKKVVDEQLASIRSQTERLLGVALPHNELCQFSLLKDDQYSAEDFLRSIFKTLDENLKLSTGQSTPTLEPLNTHDPLNPLNLGSVDIEQEIKASRLASEEERIIQKELSRRASKLSLHSSLVSTAAERLLETRKARLPCFSLAQYLPNPNFIGRENILKAIDDALLPSESSGSPTGSNIRYYALCGMGGIGKTDVAVEFAFSRRKRFGAVFWLEAGGISQIAADFGRVAEQLGLTTFEEGIDLGTSKELVSAWLENPTSEVNAPGEVKNESWLLIFDNADNLDVIADYLPHRGNGSILITTRDPEGKHYYDTGSGFDVEPLSSTEAANLLCKLTIRAETAETEDEQEASVEVAKTLDGLPLAMTQMAGFIRRRHLSLREFVDLYANDARYAEIHGVSNSLLDHRYGFTLATAYNFRELETPTMDMLKALAFLNPDRIREQIFQHAFKAKDGKKYSWSSPPAYEKARFELISSSIIKRNINRKELWIHRIIQAEVRARMDENDRYETFKAVMALLVSLWPPGNLSSQASRRWDLCEDLLPHLERLYQIYTENAEAWSGFDIDTTLPTLMNEAGIYCHERGFSHEGKVYMNLAFDLCKSANITQQPLLGDMHLTMTALTNETNDAQGCLEHNIHCLAMRKAEAEKNGNPDLRLAFAHSQMGIAYMMVKKPARAIEFFKQSIALLEALEVDPDEFGFPVCNLGCGYWVQGQLEEADKTLTDLIKQREELWGKLDSVSYKTGRALQALGNVKADKARAQERNGLTQEAQSLWQESFVIHSDCLKQYESTVGKFNHRTADICHKLAEHHIRLKEHQIAQDYLDRALSIWGNRPWFKNESARSSFLRGTHLLSLGDPGSIKKGNHWLARAKELRREILPNEKPRSLAIEDFDELVIFWSI
ncbi:tetratricopeptide repeat domain-containing protein [Pseudovirgaria hyperparasitica]|uniref:Tetratricopeptide repeat domain-containing protein n=1 Tax=Pseudovirgaria hyperparasitica TaxID=470096 RepID=A0A6A6VR08_9PEZI|nr:tetratricopeptide repeat domain-containing protein [Pseudovirgaria hyperparasitica]KAF2753098.1 tetratricopeptide repeat domain-containing protein [Pseudovirgaria hyperparasitica]